MEEWVKSTGVGVVPGEGNDVTDLRVSLQQDSLFSFAYYIVLAPAQRHLLDLNVRLDGRILDYRRGK